MKHFLLSIILFPLLLALYGFGLMPMLLGAPVFSFVSVLSFLLESIYHLVLGYLACIPISILLSSLIFRRYGNMKAIISYCTIITCLYILPQNILGEILVSLLPIFTIAHYHSQDLQYFWKNRNKTALKNHRTDIHSKEI